LNKLLDYYQERRPILVVPVSRGPEKGDDYSEESSRSEAESDSDSHTFASRTAQELTVSRRPKVLLLIATTYMFDPSHRSNIVLCRYNSVSE
jgi:hypothetical protein